MKTELIHLNDNNADKISFIKFLGGDSTNSGERLKMKKIMSSAIVRELTEKQRICLVEHYLNNKKEKDIASELGISISTVSRHIYAALKKLRRIASYYN